MEIQRRENFDCDSDIAACEIQFGKVLSETTAIKIAAAHYDKKSRKPEIQKEQSKMGRTKTDDSGFAYN